VRPSGNKPWPYTRMPARGRGCPPGR